MGVKDMLFSLTFSLGTMFCKWVCPSKLPKDFPHPREMQDFLAVIRTTWFFSSAMEKLGYGPRYQLLRSLLDWVMGDTPPVMSDDELEVAMTEFEGVEVKLYKPRGSSSGLLPGMVFLHGGGWVLGSAEEMDGLTRGLATKVRMVVASVNYRLSPEYKYPVPLDDCVKAAKFFLSNAKDFGVDPQRVAVAGDSAGGNLAAATALRLRDEKFSPALKIQVLIYPCLQALDFSTPSYQQNKNDPYLNQVLMTQMYMWYILGSAERLKDFLWNSHVSSTTRQRYTRYFMNTAWLPQQYLEGYKPLGVTEDTDLEFQKTVEKVVLDPYFSPLIAEDLKGLPSTCLMTCEQDVLRDDGLLYKHRLEDAGVSVKHDHYQALHALFDTLDLPLAQQALDNIVEYLKQKL